MRLTSSCGFFVPHAQLDTKDTDTNGKDTNGKDANGKDTNGTDTNDIDTLWLTFSGGFFAPHARSETITYWILLCLSVFLLVCLDVPSLSDCVVSSFACLTICFPNTQMVKIQMVLIQMI